ncbi:SURF1 family cytochrome oxidase biogenesis protein [uncultured Nocardioides sp.]|uniref:SURF1 family cytochrome oxidase biogenesis protein n=1 Tax=uncultured Nocardioides sp. TaxID=198441 RepID=UPI00261BBC31|nr:SURF1 family cytochrome oxidase biogenesis protein [uncultured Nocardioides sp.]
MLAVLAPRYWGAHLLALVLMAAAAGLGWWQYDSYQTRRAAEAVDLTQAEPLALTSVMGPDDPYPGDRVGQPVTVEGTWVPTGTVLVSGREHEGEDGFWLVTPLAVGGAEDPALPVVLGWTADPDAAPAPPRGAGEVVGWLQPTDGTGETDTDRTDDVIPQVRTADLIQHVEQDLYGAYAVLDHDRSPVVPGADALEPADLEQLPPPAGGTGLRNLLYALEWIVFGGEFNTPIAPVNTPKTIVDDPQFRHRFPWYPAAAHGADMLPFPVRFLGEELPVPEKAPEVGQHTEGVLSEILGYDAEQIARLRESGALG